MDTPVEVSIGDDLLATTTRPGESWLAAARRVSAESVDDPVPVDLSGPVKRFTVDPTLRVTLRPMTRGDLPDVVAWRGADHVHPWWDEVAEPGLAVLTEKYVPRIEGRSPTSMWVWEVNGRSVGMVQDYRVGDYPDYALLAPDPDAVGGDYLLGLVEWTGRGVGTRCLWAWVRHVRSRHPDLRHCFAAPDHRNRASLRALAKVGFREGLWFDQPQDDGSVDTVIGCTLDLAVVVG